MPSYNCAKASAGQNPIFLNKPGSLAEWHKVSVLHGGEVPYAGRSAR